MTHTTHLLVIREVEESSTGPAYDDLSSFTGIYLLENTRRRFCRVASATTMIRITEISQPQSVGYFGTGKVAAESEDDLVSMVNETQIPRGTFSEAYSQKIQTSPVLRKNITYRYLSDSAGRHTCPKKVHSDNVTLSLFTAYKALNLRRAIKEERAK